MKKWFIVLGLILSACGVSEEETLSEGEEVLEEKEVIEEVKVLYPDLESFVTAVEFKDGKKVVDPTKRVFYDKGEGIEHIDFGKFFDQYSDQEKVLESKRKELKKAELLENLKVTIDEEKHHSYGFLQKNTGIGNGPENDVWAQVKFNGSKLDEYKAKKLKDLNLKELEEYLLLAEEDGDYALAEKIRAHKCKRFPDSCEMTVLNLSGWVKDDQLEPVKNATISFLNNPKQKPFTVSKQGEYELQIKVRPYQLVRLRYIATGYMPYLKEIRIGPNKPEYNMGVEARLPKAHEQQDAKVQKKKPLKVQTAEGNEYEFPPGSLIRENGKPYEGDVKLYIYDFNPWEDDMGRVLDGALRFQGGVVPSAWLISYGMPYIEVISEDGERLKVLKSKPAIVRTRETNPGAVYEQHRLADETPEVFWKKWMDLTKELGSFTSDDTDTRMAAYWVYNLQTGIWDEVPMKITGVGEFESVFYTHNK